MHVRNPFLAVLLALGLLAALAVLSVTSIPLAEPSQQEVVAAKKIGGYEVVLNWPKPLPDDDLSHDGWTWGSGAGVWAESPDKVWIQQRGEIELPAGAAPWTFAGLLDPPRTNTGRWPYSGSSISPRSRSLVSCRLESSTHTTAPPCSMHDSEREPRVAGSGAKRSTSIGVGCVITSTFWREIIFRFHRSGICSSARMKST